MDIHLAVRIERQPDYTTCGPTALHAIYRYHDNGNLMLIRPKGWKQRNAEGKS